MRLRHALFVLVYVCVCTGRHTTEAVHSHGSRQGPISIFSQVSSLGPGPVSSPSPTTTPDSTTPTTTPTTTSDSTTMAPTTSSSSPSLTSPGSSSDSPTPSSSFSLPSVTPTSHSSTGTSSATPQPSSSPTSLDFTVQNMTTCTSALISWNYSGKEAELLLSITNIGFNVDDVVPSPSLKARQGPVVIEQQLADISTSAQSWTWVSVNVTQGWYEIAGVALTSPKLTNSSAPFFVSNGTDLTCLTGTSPLASATPSSTPSSSAPHTTNTSIVGGVVGAVVGVALVVFAGLYMRWRRRRTQIFGGAGFRQKKWGSLKSAPSSIQPGRGGSESQRSSGNFHGHTESTGAILRDVTAGTVSATTTPGGSDEDVVAMGEEKLVSPASSTGMNPFEVLNTPVHYDRRSSQHSAQFSPAVANDASRTRAASLRMSAQSLSQNLEQQAQRIRNSMETSTRRRSERISMPSQPSPSLSRLSHSPTVNQPQEEYPLSPVPVNRSVSTGTVSMATRRTPRKPVPQYNPSTLPEDTKTDSVSTFTGGAESSQSHGTGMAAGTNGTPPDLVRNASFVDGRPVHYLIPDMPPPQQD